jgi:amidophosphoribosyltransferase
LEDQIHDACGVFGAYLPGEDAARITFFGIYSLQHRGQEAAGIATSDGDRIHLHKDMGLVSHVFDEHILARLPGPLAIGHTRYSTTGSSKVANAHPLLIEGADGIEFAIAHNGNVTNAEPLRKDLEEMGCRFHSSTDTEVVGQLILRSPGRSLPEKIQNAMRRLEGAYSLVILTTDAVYAVRDTLGFRPLCYGRLNGGWVAASESCALDHIGATMEGEVDAGEVLKFSAKGMTRYPSIANGRRASCIFEYIYFSRPDSVLGGKLVYARREAMGVELAKEHPAPTADLVTAIPDSALPAGIGYARQSGLPFSETLVKNRYVGRTFIQPDQWMREQAVQLKFNPLPEIIQGKRLVVIDDSIVRGTTTPRVIDLLRKAGALEVHLRVCAPPIKNPCHFGVDMPNRWELIAAEKTVPEIQRALGVDSLGYLSMPGLLRAVGNSQGGYCTACFTGTYPVPTQLELSKLALERS